MKEVFTSANNPTADLNAVERRNDLCQPFTPFKDGFGSEVLTLTPQNVEQIVDDQRGRTFLPILDRLETRDSFIVQGDDLAVENCRAQM